MPTVTAHSTLAHSAVSGRSARPTVARRLVIDFLRLCRDIPLIPIERRMDLGPLVAARNSTQPRLSWVAIFIKAWARVGERRPELRRLFLPRPVQRIFEADRPLATLVVERDLHGEPALLPARIDDPGSQALREIHDRLRQYKLEPIESIRDFRRALRFAQFPSLARRLLAEIAVNWKATWRVQRVGTFGVSVTAGSGAATLSLLSPCTTTLHYGMFEPDGALPVRITFDHRVLDGAVVARAMVELETILLTEIVSEVRGLAQAAAA
jgi:hypothetical protein